MLHSTYPYPGGVRGVNTQCYKGYTDQYWYTMLHRIIWSVMIQWYTDQWWYTELHRIYWSVMIHCYTGHTDQWWYIVLHRIIWSVMIHSVTQNILISDDTMIQGYTDQWWYTCYTGYILISDDTQCYTGYTDLMIHVLHRIYWSVMIHSVTQDKLISDDTQCYTEYTDQYWYTVLHRIYWSVMIQCYTG